MADLIQGLGSSSAFDGAQYVEFAGLSSETKPTGNFQFGSLFFEVDTGTVFAWNRDAGEWVEQFSFQG